MHVFCSSLGMRNMFSKGVWGHEECWAKFRPGFRLLKGGRGCTTLPEVRIRVFQPLSCFMQQENNHKCNTKLFHRKWNAVDLPVRVR